MPSESLPAGSYAEPFRGFEPLDANYLYCPNQFFDVCLPNYSRGVLRLVAYILYRTLRWRDEEGNPIEEDIGVSYRELISEGGISRGAIRQAIDEAVVGGFIRCVNSARPNSSGLAAKSARYSLCWNETTAYVKDPELFNGFFAGDGNRSPIPIAFFNHVVRLESLATTKVVGTVLRHTVGYETKFGRRSQAPLSFTFIQKYVNIRSRPKLVNAVQHAIDAGYITRVYEGRFSPRDTERRPTTYAVRWLAHATSAANGSKREPASERFKRGTNNGSIKAPAQRFKKGTTTKKQEKETLKQQQGNLFPAAAVQSIQLLQEQGLDRSDACAIAKSRTLDEIVRQITWLDSRNPSKNRLGMLRKAIEQNWSEPEAAKQKATQQHARKQQNNVDAKLTANEAAIHREMQTHRQRRQTLLRRWQHQTEKEQRKFHEKAIQEASSKFDRQQLLRHANLEQPPSATLEIMARTLGVAVGESF